MFGKITYIFTLILLIVFIGITFIQGSDDWPMYGHDPERSHTNDCIMEDELELIWEYDGSGCTSESITIVDGLVYFGSSDYTDYFGSTEYNMYCLDAYSGSLIWMTETDGMITSAPAVVDGLVYFGSYDDYFYCLDAYDGSLKWSYQTDSFIDDSPIVVDGRVYFGAWDEHLYCLNAYDGSLIWKFHGFVPNSSLILDNRIYFGSGEGEGDDYTFYLYCLDAHDGSLIWRFETAYFIIHCPAYFNNMIYVGDCSNFLYCLDAYDGSLMWVTKTDNIITSPVIFNENIYFGCRDNNFYSLDDHERINDPDGSLYLNWSFETGDMIVGGTSIVDGKVYFGSWDHTLYCLDAYDGSLKWKYETDDYVQCAPTIYEGMIYFESSGIVYCLGPPEYNNAELIISSNPSSNVYLNDVYMGQTPINVSIESGEYTLRLEKESYNTYIQEITLSTREEKTVDVNLELSKAQLFVNSDVDSRVYLDEEFIGKSPIALELNPGNYTLGIEKLGYEVYTLELTLSPGEDKTVDVNLTKYENDYLNYIPLLGIVAIVGLLVYFYRK